ncbi:two-component regulator propeller domain-containing protein [Carboxylicivirga sp. N1Y90]|uniref:hybrid sensor histidine kinase/response regulator n=1 Tax=Carboxylicivirga fragile TaxID=3417571 RepID=UPI003D33015F|nr:response regulator [Marinilabiliaceae bacterium N1Y90]
MLTNIFVSLVLLLMLLSSVSAQKQYSFLQVNNIDGLVSDRVACIHKDSRGFIWIGTKAGLSCYDGSGFVNYKHDSSDSTSIPDNYILQIQEDKNGDLWIQTSLGYIVYNTHNEKFYSDVKTYLGIKEVEFYVGNIYFDEDMEMWIKPANEVLFARYDSHSESLDRVFSHKKVLDVQVVDFKQTNHLYYYLYNDGTIECYDDSSYQLKYEDNFLHGKMEGGSLDPGFFIDDDNDIWFYGNDNGVFHFNSAQRKWYNYSVNERSIRLSSNIIYKIIQDEKGLIWIATDHGGINILNKYSGEIIKVYHQSDNDKSLADNSVTDLYIDDNNIVWAATNKNGVSYYHESIHKFPHYRNLLSDKSSLPFSDVNCFVEDKKGNLWIGTNGGGLIYFDRLKNTYTSYKHKKDDLNSLSSDVVVSLHIDQEEELWIGTYAGGVNRFNGKRFKQYLFNSNTARGLRNNNVWSIIEDDRQNIWIGTNGGGIVIYNRETDTFLELPNMGKLNLPSQYVADLHKLSNGNIIVGTAYGASIYDTKEQRYKQLPGTDDGTHLDFINKSVNEVFEDSRGLLWIATNEGLSVIDPQTLFVKHFSSADGLPEDIMNCIEEDEFQTIWVSKSTGLSQLMVSKSSRSKEYDFQIYHFTEEDGLQSNEFNPNASYETSKNELIFGGVNGFNLFKSKDLKSNEILPKVVYTDLQVYNQRIFPDSKVGKRRLLENSIMSTKEIVLQHSMNVFSIDFRALDFFIPNKIRYKYKLEGFNEGWLSLDNTRPRVTYTNLNAGDYNLKVKASNNDGVWNDAYTELHIKVLPPFYATPIAYLIYTLLLLSLVIYFRYSMVRKERLKFNIEQERMRAKQNHEMDEMKLRFLTNVSHEFRTPLTLILTPLQKILGKKEYQSDRKLLEVIDRNARNLLTLVNQLLDFRKLELHGMRYNPSHGNIVSFLQGVIESFEEGFKKKDINFNFSHEVDQYMLNFDGDKLQKVMMNLLSNALKFTQEKGSVTVNLSVDMEMVHISVVDSGIGIKKEDLDKIFIRFYQSDINKKLGLSGSGIGLNLAREMVQLHNGTIRVESEEGVGASFIVSLPDDKVKLALEAEIDKEDNLGVNEQELETSASGVPVILLVEDNLDFRTFMKESLQDKFIVHEAADGQIAYDTVHKVLPDLIISDVMMPNVDGLELCQMLRKDIRTSHIPLILLTARSADEDKIKGLEIGADDYITKPFNMDLLMLRVNHLLQKRSKMQKQFQETVEINPSEVQITSMDEKLIKKAVSLVEENMSEAGFSVEHLSKELGMSRVYLYKKLLAITGKSPIEFIRIIRLKRGAQLLEKSQMNIAEVAYAVGFNNPRYFSKYFKEEYGLLPTAYVKAKVKESDMT